MAETQKQQQLLAIVLPSFLGGNPETLEELGYVILHSTLHPLSRLIRAHKITDAHKGTPQPGKMLGVKAGCLPRGSTRR
jgi:hypothetical protein